MENLTGFQRDLMYMILDNEKPSGQEIRRTMEEYYEDNVNHGRLYPNLDAIVEAGLVEKGTQDQRTNFYVLTDEGRNVIQERHQWMKDIVQENDIIEGIPA